MFLGTDPEFIIEDANKKEVPAWKFFPDKENKILPSIGYGLFRDGFALELNVPPAACREELARAIIWALADARKRLPEGYRIVSKPTVRVDPVELLQDAPVDALVFGCDPSWNAYTGEFASAMLDATEHPRRYAGGHMHMAWYKKHIDSGANPPFEWVKEPQQVMRFVQLLDRFVGLPLSMWFNKPETFERRQHYGQAGDFRFQNYGGQWYGVEYRTPGPEIWNTPVVASFAFGVMRSVAKSFRDLTNGWDEGLARDIRKAVDTGDGLDSLLPQCYIEVDRSYSTKPKFLDIIGKQRPFQELVAIPAPHVGQKRDPALIGWGDWDQKYDFATSR